MIGASKRSQSLDLDGVKSFRRFRDHQGEVYTIVVVGNRTSPAKACHSPSQLLPRFVH
jgi:hypothetical protein